MEKTIKLDSLLILRKTIWEVGLYILVFAMGIPAVFYFLGSFLDKTFNPLSRGSGLLDISGIFLCATGAAIMLRSVSDLWKFGRGLPASPIPPVILVTSGIYRQSRHPIYFGGSLSFLGASLLLHSFWSIGLGWPLFTLFFVAYALRVEEPVLEERFGREYRQYREETPLLWDFPLRRPLFFFAVHSLDRISNIVNRPLILKYRSHHLFLGYGLWLGAGVFIGLTVMSLVFAAADIPAASSLALLLVFTLAGLAGSRYVSMIVFRILTRASWKEAWYRVGFISWGVLAAAIPAAALFHFLTGRSIYIWFDAAFTGLMINHFFGRIGCLFYGCCYGRETSPSSLHVRYTHSRIKAVREGLVKAEALYPIQLFSSLYGLLIFGVVFSLWIATEIPVGLPASLCCILYGVFRFFEEWFRFQKRTVAGSVSPAQIICLVLISSGFVHLGWILPSSKPEIYVPLFQNSLQWTAQHLNSGLLIGLSLLTALIFSYHRFEIGSWGGETRNDHVPGQGGKS